MTASFSFLLRFYGSFAAGIILLFIAAFVKMYGDGDAPTPTLVVPLLGSLLKLSVPVPVRIRRILVLRGIIILISMFMLWLGFTTDFSTAFPAQMRFSVFYDTAGIRKALATYSPAELQRIGIRSDWEMKQREYDSLMRQSLATLWRTVDTTFVSDTAYVRREYIHAEGVLTFMVKERGFFTYEIVASDGTLQQTIDAPGANIAPFYTYFSLRKTESDFVRPRIGELLSNGYYLVRPEFKQVLSLDSRQSRATTFNHVLVGITKLRLFPHPRFGNTVYLWQAPDGSFVPIGFCVYSPVN